MRNSRAVSDVASGQAKLGALGAASAAQPIRRSGGNGGKRWMMLKRPYLLFVGNAAGSARREDGAGRFAVAAGLVHRPDSPAWAVAPTSICRN